MGQPGPESMPPRTWEHWCNHWDVEVALQGVCQAVERSHMATEIALEGVAFVGVVGAGVGVDVAVIEDDEAVVVEKDSSEVRHPVVEA